jgi:hypothetical protein
MDRRGDLFAYGAPVVEHTKQTRLERVVVLEQWMHLMSTGFYEIVDRAADAVTPADYTTMFAHFVEEYRRGAEASTRPPHYRRVYAELGDWMARWSAAFQA